MIWTMSRHFLGVAHFIVDHSRYLYKSIVNLLGQVADTSIETELNSAVFMRVENRRPQFNRISFLFIEYGGRVKTECAFSM